MKKLLSIILTIAIFVSIAVISTASVYAADTDVAKTSLRTYCLSEQVGASFESVDGYCYGYVGDADGDDTVSVMDATAIQLHCANTTELIATFCKLADVDRDEAVSVMDATAIQLHLVNTVISETINRVLYTPYDNFDPLCDTFDDIKAFILANADKQTDAEEFIENYQDDNGNIFYSSLGYDHLGGFIVITTETFVKENDVYVDTVLVLSRGSKEIQVYNTMYNEYETLYTAFANATIESLDLENNSYEIPIYYSSIESDFGIGEEMLNEAMPSFIMANLIAGEEFVVYDVAGSILDLVYDVQSLLKK